MYLISKTFFFFRRKKCRLHRNGRAYSLYGPTVDSINKMNGVLGQLCALIYRLNWAM